MDTKRNDLIRDILTAFDTIDQLRFDNMLLQDQIARLKATGEGAEQEKHTDLDLEVMKVGRKKILDDCTKRWAKGVHVHEDDDGNLIAEAYEKWLNGYVDNLHDAFSRKAFYEYFEPELRKVYEHERAIALRGDDR